MKRGDEAASLVIAVGIALATPAICAPLADELGPAPREKGVALGLFSADLRFDYQPLLEEIRRLGATHVLLAYVWWQDDVRSSEIRPLGDWSPTDAQIEATIRAAKALRLHVTTMPIVRMVKSSREEWRGRIAPEDEDRWWASYRAFILHAAKISAAQGAQRLSVGSELLSREMMRPRWVDLIERVRAETPSLELMYSANWDHYEQVTFWDLVDVVGLTAYFELTRKNDASEGELALAWAPIRGALEQWSRRIGRPLVLTEIGYPSLDGGAAWPWDETRAAPADLEEQRRAYRAAARTWSGASFVKGLYWWNWFGQGGPGDTSYTPRGKPAADVIRSWYR